MVTLKGLIYTLKVFGPLGPLKWLKVRLGRATRVENLTLDRSSFYLFRKLKIQGFDTTIEENEVIVNNFYGYRIGVPAEDLLLLGVLSEYPKRLEKIYKCDKTPSVILDVGGFIGDSALFFYAQGAVHVKVYEPVFPHFAERNLKRNDLQADVCPMGVGLGYPVYLHKECGATGLHVGSIIVKTRCISEVLNEDDYDLAKFDCEGCEYSLLLASREDINRVNKYIVECHGSPMLLYGKFKECGFRVNIVESSSFLNYLIATK